MALLEDKLVSYCSVLQKSHWEIPTVTTTVSADCVFIGVAQSHCTKWGNPITGRKQVSLNTVVANTHLLLLRDTFKLFRLHITSQKITITGNF